LKLSICMIAKNVEKHIGRCLDSIPSFCEVILVDTGSTDRTIDIAKQYSNVRLFYYPWTSNFSEARNESISQATGTHIFVIDTDECFLEDTYTQITRYITSTLDEPAAIVINNIDGNQIDTVHRMVRLFPNKAEFRFFGAVHEKLYKNSQVAKFRMSDIAINHFGYNHADYSENKYTFYKDLYQKELLKNEADGYIWYQLGKLETAVQHYEEACGAFLQALQHADIPSLYHAATMVEFSKVLQKVGLVEDAIMMLRSGKEHYKDYPDICFQLGTLYMEAGNVELMESNYLEALQIGDTTKYSTTPGVGSYLAAYNLGIYYELANNLDRAKYYYGKIRYLYKPAAERLNKIEEG